MIQYRCVFNEACVLLRQSNILTRGLRSREVLCSQWVQANQYGCFREKSLNPSTTPLWSNTSSVSTLIGNGNLNLERASRQTSRPQNIFQCATFTGLYINKNRPKSNVPFPSTYKRHYSTSFTDRHNLCSFGLMKFTNTPAAPPMPFRQNIFKKFINQIVALVIRMEHDPNFRILSLLEGAKLAIMTVSGAIAEARFDELKGLVDEKARGEIELNCSFMSDKKRRLLELCEEDTLPGTSSIYLENIRIIHQEKGNVELEASVVLSYIQNSQELLRHTESTEKPHFREVFSKVFDNIQICHYIFRKKIAKNSENSWIIQRLEHFASKHMLNH